MIEWISVKDRLPEIGKVVLFFQTYPDGTSFNCRANPLPRNFFSIGGRRYDGEWIHYLDQHSNYTVKHVSHWMPLPEVPKNDI